jgi:hypothetical protein
MTLSDEDQQHQMDLFNFWTGKAVKVIVYLAVVTFGFLAVSAAIGAVGGGVGRFVLWFATQADDSLGLGLAVLLVALVLALVLLAVYRAQRRAISGGSRPPRRASGRPAPAGR